MPHDLGKNVVAFVHRANPGDGGVARSARFRISIEIETASKSQFCLAVQNVGVHPTSNVGTVVINGVESAVSGYSGGEQTTARYETVGSGRTGHAESVKITFDPRVISYGQILRIFFAVAHDPTQRDRQGPDV